MRVRSKSAKPGEKLSPLPFDLKYHPFHPAWKDASRRLTSALSVQIETEKSAQRGQINTAGFHSLDPGKKNVENEKVAQLRAIMAVLGTRSRGFF